MKVETNLLPNGTSEAPLPEIPRLSNNLVGSGIQKVSSLFQKQVLNTSQEFISNCTVMKVDIDLLPNANIDVSLPCVSEMPANDSVVPGIYNIPI